MFKYDANFYDSCTEVVEQQQQQPNYQIKKLTKLNLIYNIIY